MNVKSNHTTTNNVPLGMSPKLMARIAGIFYLLVIAGGLFAELGVRQKLIIPGDAAMTAQNIINHESLFRIGFAVNLSYLLVNIPFAVLFYHLFKSTNRIAAQIMVLAIVVTTTIEAANLFHQLSAIDLIFGEASAAFPSALRQELAYGALQGFTNGFGVSLVFFGLVCLLYGWLILKSGLVPRVIGCLIGLAGLCYLINSYALFLAPDFAANLFPFILLPSFVGELSLAAWLTVMGVNTKRLKSAAT